MTSREDSVNLLGTPGTNPTPSASAARWSRWRYRLKIGWREPTSTIGVLMVLLFAYLIAAPIITLLHDAVEVQFGDDRRAGTEMGGWTLYYLKRTLFSPIADNLFWEPLRHTPRRTAP